MSSGSRIACPQAYLGQPRRSAQPSHPRGTPPCHGDPPTSAKRILPARRPPREARRPPRDDRPPEPAGNSPKTSDATFSNRRPARLPGATDPPTSPHPGRIALPNLAGILPDPTTQTSPCRLETTREDHLPDSAGNPPNSGGPPSPQRAAPSDRPVRPGVSAGVCAYEAGYPHVQKQWRELTGKRGSSLA